MTMGEAMEEAEIRRLVREFIRESIVVAKAAGYAIKDSYLDTALEYLSRGGNHKPSILIDIENIRMTENETHCGQIFRMAEKLGIEVPVIQTTYYFLKNLERTVMLNSYVSRGTIEKAVS
jgi:2-dehydropantoate 2-reductase